jgi:hypothetical protein
MSTKLSQKEIDEAIKAEKIAKAKKELLKRQNNKDKEVKK